MVLKEVCVDISDRYQMHFLEIGTDKDHVHFLIQSVPTYAPTKIARIVKSVTAREIFARVPEVRKRLWGGEFWSDGYYISSVGKHGSEKAVTSYVKSQGKEQEYQMLHKGQIAML